MNEYLCLVVRMSVEPDSCATQTLRKVRIVAGSMFEAALKVGTKDYEQVWQITYLGTAITAKESTVKEIGSSSRVWSWGEEA